MASQYYFGQSGTEVTRSQLRSFRRQYRQYRRTQFKEYQRAHSYSGVTGASNVGGLFPLIFVILCLFAFVGAFMGREETVTFRGLLNSLSSAPTIDMSSIVDFASKLYITEDWGVAFNWFRDFLNNFFMPIVGVAIYFSVSVAQLLLFLVWAIKFLFTGVY